VPKFGGEKALTKHLNEEALKVPFALEDAKIEIISKTISPSMTIVGPNIAAKPKSKMKTRTVKRKVTAKKISRLEKATSNLYDLEDIHGPEKPLNIDFGLYQMEDY